MTADEFIAWSMEQPEGRRYELATGKVVQIASDRARHALVKGEVFAQLRDAVRSA
jgi:Putative restriction endonuclease